MVDTRLVILVGPYAVNRVLMLGQFSPEEYTTHHDAIFVDAGSTVNLLAGVPLSSLDLVSKFFVAPFPIFATK